MSETGLFVMLNPSLTLCAPDDQKSCFACCPPIRPAGYEHLQHKNIIRRILRENTAAFTREGRDIVPITGFSCWALGYLDRNFRLAGCLLHPSQNEGLDLRFRVNYDAKCQRESCPEARTFSKLAVTAREFWLHLADGLDAFSYSGRSSNFLFTMIGWGTHLLNMIASREVGVIYTAKSFLRAYLFFSTPLSPRSHAYLLNLLISPENVHLLRRASFKTRFEDLARTLSAEPSLNLGRRTDGPYVHQLPLERDFLDYLRLALGVRRMYEGHALAVKGRILESIEEFRRSLHCC